MNDHAVPQQQTDANHAAGDCLVVGIGASAGGLDALEAFLSALPARPGFALVLVQHVGEAEQALLVETVSARTGLAVTTAEDDGVLVPHPPSLPPAGAILGIKGDRFRLRPPRSAGERRNPIDRFFHSLADACGTRAVGIVLSGSGTDGTLGLGAIGMAGGMIMAQAPGTAAYSEMPSSVAAAADHVLPPADLARMLVTYAENWRTVTASPTHTERRREIQARLAEICDILLRRTGHDFKHYKATTLVRRLERRMQVLALDVDGYVGELARDLNEPHVLFREMLIGVTSFFREPEAFAALAARVIAPLVEERGSDTVRIWVPGCASGEEAYSIAMLAREAMDRVENAPRVQIFATDVNERSLATARRGSYPQGIALQMSPERLARFFVRRGRRYQVSDELREMCLFSSHNLISDPPFSRLDLISCRNLLIYLGAHLQKKLIPVFHYALRPGGFLFLGASESLTGHSELFRVVDAKHRIAQRKDAALRVPGQLREIGVGATAAWRMPAPASQADLGAVAQRILLDEFTPKYAIVSEEGQIVFLSDGADIYIQAPAGTFSNNITRMVRRGLSVGLRTAFNEAIRRRRAITRDIPSVHTAEGLRAVRLTVQPMPEMGHEDGLYMLVFQDRGAPVHRAEDGGSHPDADAVIETLERELLRTREDLERTVQDLEAANEELKSSNEELLSMNEELQSANEELETSKEEIQAANRALAAANADLENLLRSTQIASIFLDGAGNIRTFTPTAAEIYNIAPSDIGRPLGHFTHHLVDLPPLPDLAGIQANDAVIEDEARTEDGRWFLRRVLPYRAAEAGVSGAVVTFIDFTSLKRSEEALRRSEAKLRVALATARLGAWEHDLETGELTATPICKANLGLASDFPLTAADLRAMRHPDDAERVGEAIRDAIAHRGDYDIEYRIQRPDGTIGWLIGRGHAVYDRAGRPIRLVGVTLDITDRKRAEAALAASGNRLRLALEAARMGDWSWDAATDLVTFSERGAEIFGIPPATPITWTALQDLLHAADAERAAAAVQHALATGQPYGIDYRVRRASDGGEIWVSARGQTTYGHDGAATGMIGVVQDITDRKHVEERQALLIRELHHRVKNTLATVQAIVGSTARTAMSIDEFYQSFVGRIVSLAQTHTLLTEDYWQTASLHELLVNELGPYDDDTRRRIVMEGPRVELPSDAAVPIGMAIHELTTNAAKYGALSVLGGRVAVSWTVEPVPNGRSLRFTWVESGGPPVEPPQRQGFGSRLLQRVLTAQLQAEVAIDFDPQGLRFHMTAPLPDKAQAAASAA